MTTTKPYRLEDVSTEQLRRELSDVIQNINEQLKLIASFQRELRKRKKRLLRAH